MTTEIDRLLVRVEANAVQFENSIKKLNRSMYGSQAEMRKSLDRMKRDFEQRSAGIVRPLGDALRTEVAGMATVLAGAFSAAQVVDYADAWVRGRNALAAAGVATGDLASRQGELVNLANETRTSTENTIALYRRLTIASQQLGLADAEVLRLTELLNKAFQASGATTQEAASAALQLSQALASGVLQGDELRSIRENAPMVAIAIADSMGVGIGALKELGAEGKLTGRIVADAILGAADDIESRFGATTVTVGQALQILNNELGRYIGQADQGLSASQTMAQAIVSLAENMDKTAAAVVVLAAALTGNLAGRGLAAVIGSSVAMNAQIAITNVQLAAMELRTGMAAGALGRMSAGAVAGTAAMRGLSGAMAFLGGPIGAAITAVAAGVAILAMEVNRAEQQAVRFNEATADYNDLMSRAAALSRATVAANADIGSTAGGAAGQIRIMAEAVGDLADDTYRLADANLQAWHTDTLRRIQENRTQIDELSGRRLTDILPLGGVVGGRGVAREAQVAELERQNVDLQRQLLSLFATGPEGRLVSPGSAGAAGTGAGAAPSGGTAPAGGQVRDNSAEIAARRVILDLEMQAQLLRARGREADADALDRRLEIMRLTERLEAAGVEDAEARATAYVDAMQAAERTRAAFDAVGEALNEQAEAAREAVRLATEAQEAADREALARYENARDEFRYEFVNGIRAAIDGDLGRAFEGLADRFTNRLLEQAADGLFDVIFGGRGGGKGGGGNLLTSVFGGLFGGGRAMGGPVKAGMIYRVNENTPNSEFFAPGVDGSIIPRLKGMSIPQGGGRQVIEHRITVTPERDSFIRLSADTATPIAAQAGQAAFGGARQAVPADLARRDAYRRG